MSKGVAREMSELKFEMPPRCGRSFKYNRFTKDEALDICGRILIPHKLPIAPKTCLDCYYHDGKCELGRTNGKMCIRYKDDII